MDVPTSFHIDKHCTFGDDNILSTPDSLNTPITSEQYGAVKHIVLEAACLHSQQCGIRYDQNVSICASGFVGGVHRCEGILL